METGPALLPVHWASLLLQLPKVLSRSLPEKPIRKGQGHGVPIASEVNLKHYRDMTPNYLNVNVYLM